MLLQADAKALEWVVAAYLSKDKTAYEEIRAGFDQHSDNQRRLGLPDRLTAKTFVFRLIYGGTAMAYSNDPSFTAISTDADYWQSIIEEFYSKYRGLEQWHKTLEATVIRTGELVMPTGRRYRFQPSKRNGRLVWPRTNILNYPVQGMGADLMAIARVSLHRELSKRGLLKSILPVSTVHDSILLDFASEFESEAVASIQNVWEAIPRNFEALFGVEFDLPMRVEIKVGPTWADMTEVK